MTDQETLKDYSPELYNLVVQLMSYAKRRQLYGITISVEQDEDDRHRASVIVALPEETFIIPPEVVW